MEMDPARGPAVAFVIAGTFDSQSVIWVKQGVAGMILAANSTLFLSISVIVIIIATISTALGALSGGIFSHRHKTRGQKDRTAEEGSEGTSGALREQPPGQRSHDSTHSAEENEDGDPHQ